MKSPFMDEAFALARRGLGATSPNPAVGAVLVRNSEVVGRGFTGIAKHAEITALEDAGDRAQGSTLYVTLEPCSHFGRTPPCADALIQAKITRVVAVMEDPHHLVHGDGLRRLADAGIAVELAPEYAQEAEELNEAFFHSVRTGLPLVTLKSAVTLDGKIAAPLDNSGWITSERARAHVQEVRHYADAIVTGIGTVLGDDCLLTDRTGKPRSRPLLRLVLDSTLRLPLTSRMVTSCANDLAVVTTSASSAERRRALEYRGVKVLVFDGQGGRTDLRQMVSWLNTQQYRSLMIESGSKVNWATLESGIVDKILFYYAPKILGGLQSLPVAGGAGRQRRTDALQFHNVKLHTIPPDEFIVEGYLVK